MLSSGERSAERRPLHRASLLPETRAAKPVAGAPRKLSSASRHCDQDGHGGYAPRPSGELLVAGPSQPWRAPVFFRPRQLRSCKSVGIEWIAPGKCRWRLAIWAAVCPWGRGASLLPFRELRQRGGASAMPSSRCCRHPRRPRASRARADLCFSIEAFYGQRHSALACLSPEACRRPFCRQVHSSLSAKPTGLPRPRVGEPERRGRTEQHKARSDLAEYRDY